MIEVKKIKKVIFCMYKYNFFYGAFRGQWDLVINIPKMLDSFGPAINEKQAFFVERPNEL